MVAELPAAVVASLVATTEAERTQRAILAIILVLLVVAALLALLTVWYWRHTNPRRRRRDLYWEASDADLDPRIGYGTTGDDNYIDLDRHDTLDPDRRAYYRSLGTTSLETRESARF